MSRAMNRSAKRKNSDTKENHLTGAQSKIRATDSKNRKSAPSSTSSRASARGKSKKPIPVEEMTEEQKREDRARRNRASALKSRNKRRQRLAFLEVEYKRMQDQLAQLKSENEELKEENTKLRSTTTIATVPAPIAITDSMTPASGAGMKRPSRLTRLTSNDQFMSMLEGGKSPALNNESAFLDEFFELELPGEVDPFDASTWSVSEGAQHDWNMESTLDNSSKRAAFPATLTRSASFGNQAVFERLVSA
eukprot:CAMPEP_0195523086 /NCGR_PEP_ID=MMETSP0794_2-20130614/21909_1 /TAXON_ID=515487 /ORGANISM="Stephanopyxis turris, Strain CCMP 815" /LENGTH=249 /DNA_ID=CAMNT_0040653001 /DNA_START=93 /DNA_END=842 /DNA_ORIENTATION=+